MDPGIKIILFGVGVLALAFIPMLRFFCKELDRQNKELREYDRLLKAVKRRGKWKHGS